MAADVVAHKQKVLLRLQPMVQLFSMQNTVSLSPFLVQRWSINKSRAWHLQETMPAEIWSRACYHHVGSRGVSALGKWETPPKSPSSSVQTELVQALDICPTNVFRAILSLHVCQPWIPLSPCLPRFPEISGFSRSWRKAKRA